MDKPERIAVTQEMLDTLQAHQERTGVGISKLLAGKRAEFPEGFESHTMRNVVRGVSQTVRRDHLEYLLREWEKQPDKFDIHAPVTDEVKAKLRAYQKKTGVGFKRLLKLSENVPEGLRTNTIKEWFDPKGSGRARRDHLDFVVQAYENLPEVHWRIDITDTMRRDLKAQFERTGRTVPELGKWGNQPPQGLSRHMIYSWLSGTTHSAYKGHWNWVVNTLAAFEREKEEP